MSNRKWTPSWGSMLTPFLGIFQNIVIIEKMLPCKQSQQINWSDGSLWFQRSSTNLWLVQSIANGPPAMEGTHRNSHNSESPFSALCSDHFRLAYLDAVAPPPCPTQPSVFEGWWGGHGCSGAVPGNSSRSRWRPLKSFSNKRSLLWGTFVLVRVVPFVDRIVF